MFRSISRHWWLGLLALAWFGMTDQSQAQVKFSSYRINFHVEVSSTPTAPRPGAPWYAYFPADPRLLPAPQVTPYPPFPMPFPPPMPPAKDAPKGSGSAPIPQGPMLTQNWPNYYAHGSSVQPVGFVPAVAPSYWYRGR